VIVAAGIGAGLIAAGLVTRVMAALLFGVNVGGGPEALDGPHPASGIARQNRYPIADPTRTRSTLGGMSIRWNRSDEHSGVR
jgi:hypothetical protein